MRDLPSCLIEVDQENDSASEMSNSLSSNSSMEVVSMAQVTKIKSEILQ